MKSVFIILLSITATFCFSQNKEGVITYESTMRIDVSRFPPEMRGAIPPERKSKNQLTFNEKESIYKALPTDEDTNREVTASGGGMRIQLRTPGGGDNEFYTNLEEGTSIDKTDFMGRVFLIEGDEEIDWKITGESKMIAGYQCMKATYMRDTIPIAAWFTPQIPLSLGPATFKGLPGVVLAVDSNNGRRTIEALEVDLRNLTDDEVIEVPKKGKKVTREEFEKIRDEKIQEMQEMNGGRGGRFIIRN